MKRICRRRDRSGDDDETTRRCAVRTWTSRTDTADRSRKLALLALVALTATVPNRADAQEPDDSTPSVGCLRGRPLPACRSFWIVEMQGTQPLIQSQRTTRLPGGADVLRDTFEETLEWNVGHMVNVSPTFAVGGVLTVGTGNDDAFRGARIRGRRWLTPNVSLELEAGVIQGNASGTRYPGVTGPTADLRLNVRDQGSFYVRWDALTLDPLSYPGDPGFYDPGGTQNAVSVGASLGSIPALIGTGALAVAYAVLLGALLGSD
jgi:hypothetical protein